MKFRYLKRQLKYFRITRAQFWSKFLFFENKSGGLEKCDTNVLFLIFFYDLGPLWQKMGFQLPDKSARKTVENEVESLTHGGQTPRIIVGCVVSCARTEGSGPSPKITTLTYPNLSKNSCWRDLMI